MSPSVFSRRRAERFAQLIDEANGGPRHHGHAPVDNELTKLVTVTGRLSDLPLRAETHEEFQTGLRAMLMATIEREGIGSTDTAPEPATSSRFRGLRSLRRPAGTRPAMARRTKARGAIVVGLAAGTLALSGMSAASGDAIPGDALYSMKRSTERAQLALAGSNISRGQLYLEFARTRLDEALAVQDDAAGLTTVLADMDSETKQGVRLLTGTAVERKDATALDVIDAFVGTQKAAALKLAATAADTARGRANESVKLLDRALDRSKKLRQALSCTSATAKQDELGPVPGTCKPSGGQRNEAPSGTPQQQQSTSSQNETTTVVPNSVTSPTTQPPAGNSTPRGPGAEPGTPEPAPHTSSGGGLLGGVGGLLGG